MPQITLRFNINPDGSVQEIVEGVTGHGCDLLTKPIEEALGDVLQHTRTSSFYEKTDSINRMLQNRYIEYLEDRECIRINPNSSTISRRIC